MGLPFIFRGRPLHSCVRFTVIKLRFLNKNRCCLFLYMSTGSLLLWLQHHKGNIALLFPLNPSFLVRVCFRVYGSIPCLVNLPIVLGVSICLEELYFIYMLWKAKHCNRRPFVKINQCSAFIGSFGMVIYPLLTLPPSFIKWTSLVLRQLVHNHLPLLMRNWKINTFVLWYPCNDF